MNPAFAVKATRPARSYLVRLLGRAAALLESPEPAERDLGLAMAVKLRLAIAAEERAVSREKRREKRRPE